MKNSCLVKLIQLVLYEAGFPSYQQPFPAIDCLSPLDKQLNGSHVYQQISLASSKSQLTPEFVTACCHLLEPTLINNTK